MNEPEETVDCPNCGEPMVIPDEDGEVVCPQCGHKVVTIDGWELLKRMFPGELFDPPPPKTDD